MASDSPNLPIVDYPNQAIVLDTILLEKTSNQPGNYTPKEPGAPFLKGTHSAAQVSRFEGHEFLGQKASDNDEWLIRHWGKVPSTQDIANWERSFAAESNSHPTFQRRYLEKRDSYTPRTKLSALAGLYRINVVTPGSGFTSAPSIVFTGGTGSGATAIAVLDNNGGIAKIVIKTEGSYTVAPAVTFVGGAGSGAAATAEIQPIGAMLVQEKTTDDAPEPYRSLYIVAWRIYDTLPGPELTGKTMASNGDGAICTTSRQILETGTADVSPDFRMLQWTDTPVDANRKERTKLFLPSGSFPILNFTKVDESTGIKINGTKQIVPASTTSTGDYDEIQPIDKWRSIQIISALDAASLPDPVTTGAIQSKSFPDILTICLFLASSSGSDIDIAMRYELVEGYSGPCQARITERYLDAAAYAAYTAPAITKYQPQSTQVIYAALFGGRPRTWEFKTPMSLHTSFTTEIGSTGVFGIPATIPATTPTGYSSGTWIYVDVQIERWRLGVHRILEVEVQIP